MERDSERVKNQQLQTTAALQKCCAVYGRSDHTKSSAHLGQLVQFDRLLKQALVLGL